MSSLKTYKRGPVWWVSGTIDGKAIRESLGTRDRRQAEELRVERERRAHTVRVFGETAVYSFTDAAVSYTEAGGEARFLPSLMEYFKGCMLHAIKAGHIEEAARKLYPSAKPATRIRQAIAPAVAVIRHAAKKGWCQSITVERPKIERVKRTSVDHAWIERFVAEADRRGDPRLAALVLFQYQTGTRLGEAHRVTRADLNVHAKTVTLGRTKNGDTGVVKVITTALMIRLANLPELPSGLLLSDSQWGRTTRFRMQSVCKAAGIEYVPPHQAGRHSFATFADGAGASLKEIMEAGGWKTSRILLDYIHAEQGGRKIASLFEAVQNPYSADGDAQKIVGFPR